MKRFLAMILTISLMCGVITGCSKNNVSESSDTISTNGDEDTASESVDGKDGVIIDSNADLEGAHVMILKMTGIRQYQLFYEGMNERFGSIPGLQKTADLSPSEAIITDQVKAIDEAIASKVSSISVGPTGKTGYDKVLDKAKEADIPIFSLDAPVSPEYRVAHINMADAMDVGAYLVASAIMIAQGVEYDSQAGTTVLEQAEIVMNDFEGDEINIGILSTTVDAPVQNSWILGIEKELEKDVYDGKINTEIKYTNDDLQNAAVQVEAFISENKVDSFLSLTANASVVVGKILEEKNATIKATGVGLPSQQAEYMPSDPSENAFDYPMPWILMWDPIKVGRVLASAIDANENGEYDGTIGSTLVVPASGDYEEEIFTTTTHPDGGAEIISGLPLIFDKHNINDWKDKF